MQFKRLVLCVLFISLMVCGTGYAQQTQPTITFLHYLSAETMDMLAPLFAQFERENNIKIEIITVSSTDVVTKLQVMAATGTMPDVMRLGSEYINLVEAAPFADFTPYVQRDGINMNEYFPPVLAALQYDDQLISLPTDISTYAMFYNINKFDEAGLSYPTHNWSASTWTWDDLIRTAKKLNSAPTTTPRVYGIHTLSPISMWPWWWGGDWLDVPARKTLAQTPETIQSLQNLTDAYLVHNVVGGSFPANTAAMVVNLNAAIPNYAATVQSKWDVAALPLGTQRRTILYPNGLYMAKTSEQKEAAWQFVKFITTQVDSARTWATALGRIPAMRRLGPSYIQMQKSIAPDVDHQVFLEALEHAQYPTTRLVPAALQLENALNTVFNKMRAGTVSVQAGAAEMDLVMKALLNWN
jgi:multiple sugar transport system substrate-binding protein